MYENVKLILVEDFLKSILPRAIAAGVAVAATHGHFNHALSTWGISIQWTVFQAKATGIATFLALTAAHYAEKWIKKQPTPPPAPAETQTQGGTK